MTQLVEHWTENPGVPSSNLGSGTSTKGDGIEAVAFARRGAIFRSQVSEVVGWQRGRDMQSITMPRPEPLPAPLEAGVQWEAPPPGELIFSDRVTLPPIMAVASSSHQVVSAAASWQATPLEALSRPRSSSL